MAYSRVNGFYILHVTRTVTCKDFFNITVESKKYTKIYFLNTA